MITSIDSLLEFLIPLRQSGRIALDTEADSLHCYFEKLCLIQVSIPGYDVLIDPLSDLKLESLFEVLGKHEIILHGLDYDLRLLRRVGMQEIGGVFDTMIAARLVGVREFSLAALLSKYFGVTLAKGSQKANWAKRPLSPQMEEYALNDTRYLLPLAEVLEGELDRLGRREWFNQTCEKAIEATRISRERDLDSAWRISGSGELRGRAAAMLRGLWHWRDEEARSVDRPSFHIMRNEVLIEAAKAYGSGASFDVPHLSGSRRKRFLAAVDAALALPESEWPKFVRTYRARPTPEQEKRFAELKAVRDRAAEEQDLEASLIAPKSVLESLALDFEGTLPKLLPWQQMLMNLR